MTEFIDFVNRRYGKEFHTYGELYSWSVESIPDFWESVWEFGDIQATKGYETIVDDLGKMLGAKWFSGSRLNYAENLLRYRGDHMALVSIGEDREVLRLSYAGL